MKFCSNTNSLSIGSFPFDGTYGSLKHFNLLKGFSHTIKPKIKANPNDLNDASLVSSISSPPFSIKPALYSPLDTFMSSPFKSSDSILRPQRRLHNSSSRFSKAKFLPPKRNNSSPVSIGRQTSPTSNVKRNGSLSNNDSINEKDQEEKEEGSELVQQRQQSKVTFHAVANKLQREKAYGLSSKMLHFCSTGQLERAFLLFQRLVLIEKKIKPTVVLYNTIMTGCKNEGQVSRCWKLFADMKRRSLAPDTTTFMILLDALAISADRVLKRTKSSFSFPSPTSSKPAELSNYMDRAWFLYQDLQNKYTHCLTTGVLNCLLKVVGRVGDLEALEIIFPLQRPSSLNNLKSMNSSKMNNENDQEPSSILFGTAVKPHSFKTRSQSPISPSAFVKPDIITFQTAIQAASHLNAPLNVMEGFFCQSLMRKLVDIRLINLMLEVYKRHLSLQQYEPSYLKIIIEKARRLLCISQKPTSYLPQELFVVDSEELSQRKSTVKKEEERNYLDKVSYAFAPIGNYFPCFRVREWYIQPNSVTHGLFLTICRFSDAYTLGIQYFQRYCKPYLTSPNEEELFCHYMAVSCFSLSSKLAKARELFLKTESFLIDYLDRIDDSSTFNRCNSNHLNLQTNNISKKIIKLRSKRILWNMIKVILKGCGIHGNLYTATKMFEEQLSNTMAFSNPQQNSQLIHVGVKDWIEMGIQRRVIFKLTPVWTWFSVDYLKGDYEALIRFALQYEDTIYEAVKLMEHYKKTGQIRTSEDSSLFCDMKELYANALKKKNESLGRDTHPDAAKLNTNQNYDNRSKEIEDQNFSQSL